MGEDGAILDERISNQGMGGLASDAFEAVLLSEIEGYLGAGSTPIIACGMVGSRQGWQEAPYAALPTQPFAGATRTNANDARLDVRILSGIKQHSPANVMRGEETQIAGFLAREGEFCGSICLPGTHSKWAAINAGKIMRFETALTGELFGVLTSNTILRHSLGEWDEAAFVTSVRQGFEAPQKLSSGLFSVRARALIEDDKHGIARISGWLIGAELAGAAPFWQKSELVIVGSGELPGLYAGALDAIGKSARQFCAKNLTILGLTAAHGEIFA